MKRFGFGFGATKNSPSGGWLSLVAKAYYEALVVANGNSELGLEGYKLPIDEMFFSLSNAGVLSKLKRFTPRLGSSLATNGINALNPGMFDGTFFNSPSVVAGGIQYDGVSQYEDTGFSQLDFNNVNDCGYSFQIVNQALVNPSALLGNYNTAPGTFMGLFYIGNLFNALGEVGGVDSYPVSTDFFTYTRLDSGDLKTYVDGVNVVFTPRATAYGLQNYNMFIGCYNNIGTPALFGNVALRNEVFHDNLTASEISDLYSIINDFDVAIGR